MSLMMDQQQAGRTAVAAGLTPRGRTGPTAGLLILRTWQAACQPRLMSFLGKSRQAVVGSCHVVKKRFIAMEMEAFRRLVVVMVVGDYGVGVWASWV